MPDPARDRPFVLLNMAMTVDGKITSARREYPRLTGGEDRRNMDRLRAEADAVLVGAGTIRADQPNLHVRDPAMQQHRESLGRSGGLLKIVVTAGADIPADSRLFADPDGGGVVIATVEQAPAQRVDAWPDGVEVWRLGARRVDLRELLARLRARGIARLLCEGGGELNWELLQHDLVDELYVTVAPALLGGRDAPTLLEGPGLPMARRVRLQLLDVRREGDELYCRYGVKR